MKKLLSGAIATLLVGTTSMADAKTYHIMLQGFHWDSNNVSSGWYNIMEGNAQRIADSGFTSVWFPPPSDTADNQGYLPRQLYNVNTRYGSENDLRDAISALDSRGIDAIADIVINHRVGTTGWADFTNPTWPSHTIASNDEWNGTKSQNWDTGEGYGPARDLDHLHPDVLNGYKAWMNWLKNDIGFDGWRYDFVKGYHGAAIAEYNGATNPSFSVGEYWDGNTNSVLGWIDSTNSNWQLRSTAFDFPLRNALHSAVSWGQYSHLRYGGQSTGVIGQWADKAVTFIENHDTEEARNGKNPPAFPDGGQSLQGYAFLLTHPGTPSVFWRDIYDSGNYNENMIRAFIRLRQEYGIHSESSVWIAKANDGDGYAAYIQGDNGEIAMKIGPGGWAPSGGKWDPSGDLIESGTDFAIWGENGKWW